MKAMAAQGILRYPLIAINEADTKHMFDNRYGTGQSTLDRIIRATNVLVAGKTFVVAGYGWRGPGLASRAEGPRSDAGGTQGDPVNGAGAATGRFPGLPHGDPA